MTPTTNAGRQLAEWLAFAGSRLDGVPGAEAVVLIEAEAAQDNAALREALAAIIAFDPNSMRDRWDGFAVVDELKDIARDALEPSESEAVL